MTASFTLPLYIDLSATFLYAMTGALLAIRRHYNWVGLFVLALVSGVGGGLIRDGILIQNGPPLAMSDGRYLLVCKRSFCLPMLSALVAMRSLESNTGSMLSFRFWRRSMTGVVTACGGGLLRDVLVRDEPLLFKPGQLYVLAALIGASLFTLLILFFKTSAVLAALIAIGCCFVFRILAIAFNWKTVSVSPASSAQA